MTASFGGRLHAEGSGRRAALQDAARRCAGSQLPP